jgi:hypothetical protein
MCAAVIKGFRESAKYFVKVVKKEEMRDFHRKDAARSDSMDVACDMVELPWIFRKALLVLNKLEARHQFINMKPLPNHWQEIIH